jgi:hypothetical protein
MLEMIRIDKQLGSFNWANTREKSWLVSIRVNDMHSVNAHFPEDEEPDIDGLAPLDVLDLIEMRNGKYLYRGSAKQEAETIKYIRDNAADIEREWAEAEIKELQKESARIYQKIESLRYSLAVES